MAGDVTAPIFLTVTSKVKMGIFGSHFPQPLKANFPITRSGFPIEVTTFTGQQAQLLASLLFFILSPASITAQRKYSPAGVSLGIVLAPVKVISSFWSAFNDTCSCPPLRRTPFEK